MKLDRKPFDDRVERKLLSRREKNDLLIYNYTNQCVWNRAWDKYTEMARGLILHKDGTVIARPFPKFFNIGETGKTEIKNLPEYKPEITEKLDGSLGILFKDGDYYSMATRGSFDSEQAIWATNWFRSKNIKEKLLDNITYLWEIVYPMNRIVVDYKGRAECVLIGLVHNYTGKIHSYKDVIFEGERLGVSYPKPTYLTIEEIQQLAEAEKRGMSEEGFVIFYPHDNLQIKIKYADYVRLHRLTFGISVKSIWENMMYGQKVREIFADAPDEVMNWIEQWAAKFAEEFARHESMAKDLTEKVIKMATRKEQALYLQEKNREYLPIVFNMLDKRDYRKAIFNKFRPKAEDANKSFKMVGEDV